MLKLKKGGKLEHTYWHFDKQADKGSWLSEDVTDQAIVRLFDYVELDEDVTLKDVFLLLNTELDVFDAILGNWCKEIVTEGLTPKNSSKDHNIDYLELYWSYSIDKKWDKDIETKELKLTGNSFPCFHGWGDWPTEEGEPVVKGGLAIEFLPANEIADYPLKLKNVLEIYNYTNNKVETYSNPSFTLCHILQGIIWELSFCGSPVDRDKRKEELDNVVEEINNEQDA